MVERGFGNAQVVLAAHRQDDAASCKQSRIALESQEGFAAGRALAKVNAVDAVVANHAAPQGVVQIQYQAFARQADTSRGDASQLVAIQRREVGTDQLFGLMPAHRFGQTIAVAPACRLPRQIHQQYTVFAGRCADRGVQAVLRAPFL